jgi:hypothetical protein
MFQTQMTASKPTRWYQLLALLVASFLLAGFIFSLGTAGQAHAATISAQSSSATPNLVSGSITGSLAGSQIGDTCGDYYGCPYPGEWCAEFARAVWQYSDADISGLTGASASFYQYGQNHHTLSNTPKVGDAVVFGYSNGYAQHVAIVVSVDTANHTIKSVGGNERGGAGVVAEDGPYNWTVGYSSYWQMDISGYVSPVAGNNACPANVQQGSSGSEVQFLQAYLNYDYDHGVFPNSPDNFHPPLAIDGQFGPLTRSAVVDFQFKVGLGSSGGGVAGSRTWTHLGACG